MIEQFMTEQFMQAIVIDSAIKGGGLVLAERLMPKPAPHEVLVAVSYAGINRPDVLQRQGHYPPPSGISDNQRDVPGLEVSGIVVGLGRDVTKFQLGDKVFGLVVGGGYAEFCTIPEATCFALPEGLSLSEAACIPETFFTVYVNVFMRGGLKAGEWLLVHGGASGIGTTAIMLGAAFGAHVIVTAGSAEKCAACMALGAIAAINYRDEDFVARVRDITSGHGADVILDMVGGDYVSRNYRCAAEKGRIAQIAFLEGADVTVDLRPLMMKRLTHTGSTLRARTLAEKAEIADGLRVNVLPLLAKGALKPKLDAVFPLKDAMAAHQRMEAGAHIGKVVLAVKGG